MSKAYLYFLVFFRFVARFPILSAVVVCCSNWWHRDGRIDDVGTHLGLNGVDDVSTHIENLRKHGFSAGLSLDSEFVDELKNKFLSQTLTEDKTGKRISAMHAIESGGSAAFRWINPHKEFDKINLLAHDKRLVDIAGAYLGCTPILHSTQIWLLNPPNHDVAEGAEYGWHYDIDDFGFVKVFFYLTDTAEVNGQHMLVGNSHRNLTLHKILNRRISDIELRKKYNERDIHRMDGVAGQGFFEDTWLYHKATPPTGQRMMMQIEYCATGVMKYFEKKSIKHQMV